MKIVKVGCEIAIECFACGVIAFKSAVNHNGGAPEVLPLKDPNSIYQAVGTRGRPRLC